jgi:hypothetical protein
MEDNQYGMDPAVKQYFKKILRSFSVGLLWMIIMVTVGLFFEAAIIKETVRWYNVVFYLVFVVSLFWLVRFFFKSWRA